MESRTRILCITISILLIAGCVSIYIFWVLMRQSIEKVHTVNAAIEQQVMHRDENTALKNLLTEVEPHIDSLQSRIVDTGDTVAFIDRIESLARQSGATVSIDSVGEQPADEGKDYQYIELTMSTQGSWNHVHTFISMIESLPYKVTIKSIVLSQGTAEQSSTGTTSKQQIKVWKGTAMITVLKKK